MRNLCAISMLVLGIAGNVFCQKSRADTTLIFSEKSPPIISVIHGNLEIHTITPYVKRSPNHIVINFGKKNVLKIDYQGTEAYIMKHNIDSLLAHFWNDYLLIRDTLNKDMVKKITYHGKNKDINNKGTMEVQYYPQREVFQFGRSVELVRLKQDTLLIVDYEVKSGINGYNKAPIKSFETKSFLFNLNTIDDVEEILDFGVNQAVIEAGKKAESERKNAKPWKHVNIRNDLMTQKIKSSIIGPALFDFLNLHYDFGIGLDGGKFLYSATAAVDFVSLNYRKKGIALGLQSQYNYKNSKFKEISFVFFSGMTFYQNKNNSNLFKGGIFLGYAPFVISNPEKGFNIKLFGWYQLTPLIRIQPELSYFEFNRTNNYFKYDTSRRGIKISFGI